MYWQLIAIIGCREVGPASRHRQMLTFLRPLSAALPEWLTAAKKTALAGFANRLARDQQAIEAALTLPWSQGHVEGQIHRFKLIKRQMYGRAGFDLLRLRVLHAA